MMRKSLLAVVVAGSLIAAAAALVPKPPPPSAGPNAEFGNGHHMSRHVKGKFLESCLEQPVECGLVVW